MTVPLAAKLALYDVYKKLDEDIQTILKENKGDCRSCGECCMFPDGVPVLYASLLEREVLLDTPEVVNTEVERACPYYNLHTKLCTAREKRTIGCRTHFCILALDDKLAREEAEALCEKALQEIAKISTQYDIEWDYREAVFALRESIDA